MKKKVIIGYGGHASVLIDIIGDPGEVFAICDKDTDPTANCDLNIVSEKKLLDEFSHEEFELINGVGYIPGSNARLEVWEKFKLSGYQFFSIMAPTAIISDSADLFEGVQILHRAVVSNKTKIGNNTIINTGAIVEHHCSVGDSCHIAPGAILCGGVKVANHVFVGAGAIILPNVTLSSNTVVPAGDIVRA